MNHADQLLAKYILRKHRYKRPTGHLAECDQVTVEHPQGEDGFYGCETGCEYVTLSATLRCTHGQSEHVDYGDFGTLNDIIEEMAKAHPPTPPEGTVQLAYTMDGRQVVMNSAGEISVTAPPLKRGCCEDEACYGACECEDHDCEYGGPHIDTP